MSSQDGFAPAASGVLLLALCPAALPISGGTPTCVISEEVKLIASDPEADVSLGWAVDILGDTLVVGAPRADHSGLTDAGAVYVFVRSGTSWSEEAKLVASDADSHDDFGCAVALSGNRLLVGAKGDDYATFDNAGCAYVFVRNATGWDEQAKIKANDPSDGAGLGMSVDLEGDTALVGAPVVGGPGKAYVFVKNGAFWNTQKKLQASDGQDGDGFGKSVALSGETALVGAREDNLHGTVNAGSAYVFVRSGTAWSEQQHLSASDFEFSDYFGGSVALLDDTALIGAVGGDNFGLAEYYGAAYVFVRSGASWSEAAKLSASDAEAHDNFGIAVALAENRAVVGAYMDGEPGSDSGSAYVFEFNGTSWSERQKLVASDGVDDDYFGDAIAVMDDDVVIGARGDEDYVGAAYVFRLSLASAYCTAGSSASGCQASLSACGTASATAASGFVISATEVEGAKDGLFFFGTSGRQANPWGTGTSYQCVVPPVVRAPIMTGSGTVGACDGSFALDLNALWCPTCPSPAKNPGATSTVQAQLWYRDPLSTSNQTTSLSDAVEFVIQP